MTEDTNAVKRDFLAAYAISLEDVLKDEHNRMVIQGRENGVTALRKQILENAIRLCPEAEKYIRAYQNEVSIIRLKENGCLGTTLSDYTENGAVGNTLMGGIGNVSQTIYRSLNIVPSRRRRGRKNRRIDKEIPQKTDIMFSDILPKTRNGNGNSGNSAEDKEHTNIMERYKDACNLGFVPEDKIVVALMRCSITYPAILRTKKLSDDFQFDKIDTGFSVIPKVSRKNAEINMLLEKLQEMDKRHEEERRQSEEMRKAIIALRNTK